MIIWPPPSPVTCTHTCLSRTTTMSAPPAAFAPPLPAPSTPCPPIKTPFPYFDAVNFDYFFFFFFSILLQ